MHRVTRTHCPYCALQCGMRLEVASDSSPEVLGDETFPVNRGLMCIKGFNAGALLARPDRIQKPLLRNAQGALEPVSWDRALDFVGERLLGLKSQFGPTSLATFGSGALTNEKAYLLGKFTRVVLGSPNIDYNGRYCMASAAGALNQTLGLDRGLPFPVSDIAEADVVLSWGSNWADTLPPIAQWFAKQRQAGGQQIVVDPRRTATADSAALFLQPLPGSDLALANGLLYVALDEDLIDREFIDRRTSGFEAVRAVALQYWPGRVEQLTGVPEQALRQTVRMMASAERAILVSGRGPEQQSKGVDTVIALINFMLAIGKQGRPGCGYGCLTGQGNGQGGREHGQKADQLPGYRLITDPQARETVAAVWGVPAESLPGAGPSAYELLDALGPKEDVERGNGPEIRGLLVCGSNVVVASPDSERIRQRLGALDLLVVCDAFMNDTAEHAHVVLPVLQWAEEDGTMTNLEGRVIRRRMALSGPAEARSELWILRELARRLGSERAMAFDSAEAVFNELARATAGARADYSGMTYAKLDRQNGVFWPCKAADDPGTPRMFLERFAHSDGRARFIAVEHRAAAELPDAEFPYYFTTGRYREHYNSGVQTRGVHSLSERKPEPRLEMHPALLRQLGLHDGETVRVSSRRGQVLMAVLSSPSIRRDTVFAPFHWGGRQAANILTNPALDPKSRMPEFKVCAVQVTRLQSVDAVTGAAQGGAVQENSTYGK